MTTSLVRSISIFYNNVTVGVHRPERGIHRHQIPYRYHNAASHASPYGPLRPNVTSSIKPEVRNVSQLRQRRTEPRPQGIRTTNFVQIGPAVPDTCSRTDRHTHTDRRTDRQTDCNTLLPCRGGVIRGATWKYILYCNVHKGRHKVQRRSQWFPRGIQRGTAEGHCSPYPECGLRAIYDAKSICTVLYGTAGRKFSNFSLKFEHLRVC